MPSRRGHFFCWLKKSNQKKSLHAKNRSPARHFIHPHKSLAPSLNSYAGNGFFSGCPHPKIPASAVFAPHPPFRRINSECIYFRIQFLLFHYNAYFFRRHSKGIWSGEILQSASQKSEWRAGPWGKNPPARCTAPIRINPSNRKKKLSILCRGETKRK